jgi:hypothetical protein
MHAYQHRSPSDLKNRYLIAGPPAEKTSFIELAQADITYLNLCQTLEQKPQLHVANNAPMQLVVAN